MASDRDTEILQLLCIASHLLKVPAVTKATATILFFKCNNYLKHNDMKDVPKDALKKEALVMAITNLACKQTECHRKIRDVVNSTYWAQYHDTREGGGAHLKIGKEYWTWRDILIQAELVVLRILNFDLQVQLPFQWLPEIIDDIFLEDNWNFSGGVQGRNGSFLAQISWDYVCFFVSEERIVMKHNDLTLALSSVYLAMKALKFKLPWRLEKWCKPYQKRGCTVDQIREAINDMIEFL